jgi:predicted TIM-barrel fold metal-dependent hydrolase
MRTARALLAALAAAFACASALAQPAPAVDHHQHLFSPVITELLASPAVQRVEAKDVVALLDAAGIRRAVLLSTAYMFGRPNRKIDDEYAKVRAENDWTAAQAAAFPDRLRAFCGVNPLRDYALDEIARCAGDRRFAKGVKLHFGNSDIQLENPAHREAMKTFFRTAERHGLAIVVHMRASISNKRPYGAEQARAFLELLAAAPNVPVQVAHLASAGPGYQDPPAHEVMAVLARAREEGDPRARNLWFDVASIVDVNISAENAALVVRLLRQVGLERVLYGTDAAAGDNLRPAASWAAFRKLPLTPAELARIAQNVAPYLQP